MFWNKFFWTLFKFKCLNACLILHSNVYHFNSKHIVCSPFCFMVFTTSKRVVVLGAMGVITMLFICEHARSFCNSSLFAIWNFHMPPLTQASHQAWWTTPWFIALQGWQLFLMLLQSCLQLHALLPSWHSLSTLSTFCPPLQLLNLVVKFFYLTCAYLFYAFSLHEWHLMHILLHVHPLWIAF